MVSIFMQGAVVMAKPSGQAHPVRCQPSAWILREAYPHADPKTPRPRPRALPRPQNLPQGRSLQPANFHPMSWVAKCTWSGCGGCGGRVRREHVQAMLPGALKAVAGRRVCRGAVIVRTDAEDTGKIGVSYGIGEFQTIPLTQYSADLPWLWGWGRPGIGPPPSLHLATSHGRTWEFFLRPVTVWDHPSSA